MVNMVNAPERVNMLMLESILDHHFSFAMLLLWLYLNKAKRLVKVREVMFGKCFGTLD